MVVFDDGDLSLFNYQIYFIRFQKFFWGQRIFGCIFLSNIFFTILAAPLLNIYTLVFLLFNLLWGQQGMKNFVVAKSLRIKSKLTHQIMALIESKNLELKHDSFISRKSNVSNCFDSATIKL